MTSGSELVLRAATRAASMYGRLVWGLEALLSLFDLSVRVLVLAERKPSYCLRP